MDIVDVFILWAFFAFGCVVFGIGCTVLSLMTRVLDRKHKRRKWA